MRYWSSDSDVRITTYDKQGYVGLVWKVEDCDTSYILKQHGARVNEQQIIMCTEFQRILSKSLLAPNIEKTIHNSLFIKKNNYFYTLSKFVKNEEVTRIHHSIYKAYGVALGSMHNVLDEIPRDKFHISFIKYSDYYDTIANIKKTIQRNDLNNIDKNYLELKLSELKQMSYDVILKLKLLKCSYIHGDAHCNNILFDEENGSIKFIDFDQASYFPKSYELIKLILSMMSKFDGRLMKIKVAKSIIRGYLSINNLSDFEISIVTDLYYYVQLCDMRDYDEPFQFQHQSENNNIGRKYKNLITLKDELKIIKQVLLSL